jgi:hypothetical protein
MKNLFVFILFTAFAAGLSAQDVRFSMSVSGTGATRTVSVFASNVGTANNLTGFTSYLYYDNTKATLASFDATPVTAGTNNWGTTNQTNINFQANANPAVTSPHNGFFFYQNFDNNFAGFAVSATPTLVLTATFNVISASGGSFFLAGTNHVPPMAYLDNAINGFPVDGLPFSDLTLTNTFIEGYMNGATMRPVLANAVAAGGTVPTFTPPTSGTACDIITVDLHAATAPYALVHTTTATLTTAGAAAVRFPAAASGNSFYVVVKGRNIVETWSAAPVAFTSTASYSFATAYGSNLGAVGGVPVIYSGDIAGPQDGNIDFFDYPIWETDYNNFVGGYYPSDLNGDGNVDFFDYPIWETNYNNFVGVSKP